MIGYQAQVLPAILAGFALVFIEKFFRKITPALISMIVVPFCSLVLAVLVAHTILGPIGWVVGGWISDIVWAGLNSNVKWLFATIFGFVYAPLVITGLHHMTNAIDSQLVASFGGTNLWPMIALSNIAQGSAVLAMSVLQKKNEKAQQIAIPAMISCYLGVTEPAIFGVNLRYGFPFLCGMVGSSLAAIVSVSFGAIEDDPYGLKFPKIGRIHTFENVHHRLKGAKVTRMTITEEGGRWYASLTAEADFFKPAKETRQKVGVDLGIRQLAVLSDGTVYENPKHLARSERKLKRGVSKNFWGLVFRGHFWGMTFGDTFGVSFGVISHFFMTSFSK